MNNNTITTKDGVEIYYKDWHRHANRLLARLAALIGRLGCTDDVLPRKRLPRDCP